MRLIRLLDDDMITDLLSTFESVENGALGPSEPHAGEDLTSNIATTDNGIVPIMENLTNAQEETEERNQFELQLERLEEEVDRCQQITISREGEMPQEYFLNFLILI